MRILVHVPLPHGLLVVNLVQLLYSDASIIV